nr:3-deoxy-7-phosphoheptulonate synthase [Pseudonocardia acaciae]
MVTIADGRAETVTALPAPSVLAARFDVDAETRRRVAANRRAVRDIVEGVDDRLLVVVGPCSVHDPVATLDYASRLSVAAAGHAGELLLVLRAYLEKPRSELGWKGLLHDPGLDGREDLALGLEVGRRFLTTAASTGLPLAYEFVDPFLAPFVLDLLSWGAIGARTVASQPHRQLASGVPIPVGMKNTLDGDVGVAASAVRSASATHTYPGLGADGTPVVLAGHGNPACHVVLRGGREPNYDAASVTAAVRVLEAAGLPARVVVDASHGNSGKDHRRQPLVVANLAEQVARRQRGLFGVMIESFLEPGCQRLAPGGGELRYGVSVTDACLGWAETERCLDALAHAVRRRRERTDNGGWG